MAKASYGDSYGIVRFKAKSALIYGRSTYQPPRTEAQIKNESNLSRGDKSGFMSHKTKLKVKRILQCWITGITEFKNLKVRPWLVKMPYLTFVTLTLSAEQEHTDKEIRRKLVQPFIQKLIRHHKVWHYLFVCEKQENGNIHIHLVVDSYIEHEQLRREWNETQAIHGYIDRFEQEYKHRNPNSTDIHSLKDVQSVESYLVKYLTTDKKEIPIQGRLWGCSDSLRKLKPYEEILCDVSDTAIREMTNSNMFRTVIKEEFTLILGNVFDYLNHRHPSLMKKIKDFYITQAKSLYTIHPMIIEQNKLKMKAIKETEEKKTEEHKIKFKINPQLQLNY